MKIERFEDIEAWQLARELARKVYLRKYLDEVREFKGSTVQGLKTKEPPNREPLNP